MITALLPLFSELLQVSTQIHDYPVIASAIAISIGAYYAYSIICVKLAPYSEPIAPSWEQFPDDLKWDRFQRVYSDYVKACTGKGTDSTQNSVAYKEYRRFQGGVRG